MKNGALPTALLQRLVRVHSERERSHDGSTELRVRLPGRPVLPERSVLRRRAGGRHRAAHELLAARVRPASGGRPDPPTDAEFLVVRLPRRRLGLAGRRRPVRLQRRPQLLRVRRPVDHLVHRRQQLRHAHRHRAPLPTRSTRAHTIILYTKENRFNGGQN